jgi:hypothetical protein
MFHFRFKYVIVAFGLLAGCGSAERSLPEDSFDDIKDLIDQMEVQGDKMASQLDAIAHYYEYILTKKDSILKNSAPDRYTYAGPISTNLPGQDSSRSSIIILNTTPDRKKAELEVVMTNPLDSLFAEFIRDNPRAVQIYSNSPLQVSRVYPAYDAKNIVDFDIDVTEFNFYYKADQKNNPSRGLIWIPEPYVDPAGKGWILSLIHPVYDGDELFAVLGVDYTVTDLIQNYLDSKEGDFVLVNAKGDIVAGKADAIEMLSMPPLKNHVYKETVSSDFFRVSDFNLFSSKSREVREMAQKFLLERKNRFEFNKEANLTWAVCAPFRGIDWFLIEVYRNY